MEVRVKLATDQWKLRVKLATDQWKLELSYLLTNGS